MSETVKETVKEEKAIQKPEKPKAPAPLKQSTWFFKVARGIMWVLMRTITPIRYFNPERLKTLEGPAIVIGNHKSMGDPLVIAAEIPKKEITYMAKVELTKNAFMNWLMRSLHVIPVNRGSSDMNAMRTSLRLLKEGGILGIFPEGTRHKEGVMEDLESGAAMIALRSGVPVIPVYITPRFRPFHRTDCWIGEPIPTEDLRQAGISKETCDLMLKRMTETYVVLQKDHAEATKKS